MEHLHALEYSKIFLTARNEHRKKLKRHLTECNTNGAIKRLKQDDEVFTDITQAPGTNSFLLSHNNSKCQECLSNDTYEEMSVDVLPEEDDENATMKEDKNVGSKRLEIMCDLNNEVFPGVEILPTKILQNIKNPCREVMLWKPVDSIKMLDETVFCQSNSSDVGSVSVTQPIATSLPASDYVIDDEMDEEDDNMDL